MHWKMLAVELGSERHTKQFLCLLWYMNSNKCDERHCAEPTSNSMATQTLALDVPTQEPVEDKRGNLCDEHCRAHETGATRERFAQIAKEPGVMESSRRRHRLEGEGQPLAPSASGVRCNNRSSSGPVLLPAPPPPPPSLEPPPLAKWSLERVTEKTDTTVEQQDEATRRREHPEVPQSLGQQWQ